MRIEIGRRAVSCLALACALLCAPAAHAAYDPLGSGTTKLALDKGFLAFAKANGIKLSAVAPAKLAGGVVSFPVVGGKFDPVSSNGTVEHDGALVLRAGNRSVPIKTPQLKTTQRHAPISAKVGGSQLKIATAGGLQVTRGGFADKVKVTALEISAKLATRLGKKLRLKGAFKAGQPLGSTRTKANPQTVVVLDRGRASLTLDPALLAKLDSLHVAVNPIFPAEHPAAFTFPIFGGAIAPNGRNGLVKISGSLEFLQLGAGQVFWAEPWLELGVSATAEVDVEPTPAFPGKLGRIGILDLAAGTASSDPKARTITVAGAQLALQAQTAATFNQAFAAGKEAFKAGEPVGSVSFTAQAQ